MRLKTIVPPLPDNLLTALEHRDIRTDADLLFSGTALEIYERLPQGIITLAELEALVQSVISHVSTPAIRGDELLERETAMHEASPARRISCGVPALDALTNGYSGPKVLEISGDHGSGKTVRPSDIVDLSR